MKSKPLIESLLKKSVTIGERYNESIKLNAPRELFDPKDWPESWKKVYFKSYGRFPEIKLPKVQKVNKGLGSVLAARKTSRDFTGKKISIKELSTILYYSAGIRRDTGPDQGNRFYPSGGARYPLEVYVLSLNSELPRGLYHYYLKNHSLEELLTFDTFKFSKYFTYPWAEKASCIIIISSIFPRSTMKYGDRGYKFSYIESGHLAQNIYLIGALLEIKCAAMAGFVDKNINKLIDLDGVEESVIYTIAIGK